MQEVGLIINQILQQKMWNRCRQLLIIDKWNELVGRERAVTRAKQVNKSNSCPGKGFDLVLSLNLA